MAIFINLSGAFPILIGADREVAASSFGQTHSIILINLTIKISLNNFFWKINLSVKE